MTNGYSESETMIEMEYEYLFVIRDILLLSCKHISSIFESPPDHINRVLRCIMMEIEEIIV